MKEKKNVEGILARKKNVEGIFAKKVKEGGT
jgi:hypothetical protein